MVSLCPDKLPAYFFSFTFVEPPVLNIDDDLSLEATEETINIW